MKKLYIYVSVLVNITLTATFGYAGLNSSGNSVWVKDGKISIQAHRIPFLSILKQISNEAHLDIYMVEQNFPNTVTLSIEDYPIEKALQKVLRGYNYAIVYSSSVSGGGGIFLGQYLTALEYSHSMIASVRDTESIYGDTSRQLKMKQYHTSSNLREAIPQSETKVAVLSKNSPEIGYSETANGPDEVGTTYVAQLQQAGAGRRVINGTTYGENSGSGSSARSTDAGDLSAPHSSASQSETFSDETYIASIDTNVSAESAEQLSASYGEQTEASESQSMNDEEETPDGGTDYPSDVQDEDLSERELFLADQIARIERQIESGYAQRWYEKWSQIKDPRSLQSPEEQLAFYQEELEKLRSQ